MKNKWIVASTLIVILVALCGVGLYATWQGVKMISDSGIRFRGLNGDHTLAKATEEKSLEVSGPVSLNVENDFGNVNVKVGSDTQVNIKAEKTAWGGNDAEAQAALKDLKVVIEQDGNTIHVSVQQPTEVVIHANPGSDNVKLTITVPKQTAASLHSSVGNATLDGTTGNADVRSDFGEVVVTNITGLVQAKSSNGTVTGQGITADGALTFSSDFGSVTLKQISGSDITVSSDNGKIELEDVQAGGLLKVHTQFGNIHISGSHGKTADIKSTNGAITLENLSTSDDITVKSDFGDLKLTGVDANGYDLNTQNGTIKLDGARNAIKAHSNFGSIEVLNAQNARLDLSSSNGAVTFSGSLGSGPHTISSDFGNIQVTLPAETAINLEMQTDFGKISSDFSITLSGTMDSKHWSGTVNGGGAKLSIKTNNGNITLQSSNK